MTGNFEATAALPGSDRLQQIRAQPKADLHLHLLGALRPDTAFELAGKYGVSLSFRREEWLDTFASGSLARFVEGFIEIFPLLQSSQDFERVAWEMCEDLGRDGVAYAEPRVTLTSHLSRGVRPSVVGAGLASAARQAHDLLGVEVHWVVDFPRILGVDTGALALHHAVEGRKWGVVAFDVAGYEPDQEDDLTFNALFQEAARSGLKLTAHAGEIGPASHVRRAVEKWKVDRIGHGIRSVDDASVVNLLRDRGTPLEISPTSNIRLGATPDWESHPLEQLRKEGVPVVLCTDDPALFGVSLSDELAQAASVFGWSDAVLEEVIRNGWEYRFVK